MRMKWAWTLILVVAFIFTVSRLVWLELDPPMTKRIEDIGNAVYWLHNARMEVLTGEFLHDPFNQALITAHCIHYSPTMFSK